uniref:Uncharacterized protein n=1 Tax=Coccidioides posadasii RMSCC 3488 TaxID=454284 RepID=A0A0J6F5J0_COCPO|nr:hypothetical protein CPAG_04497 [Coccidioides posadasii RMSCC 3488]
MSICYVQCISSRAFGLIAINNSNSMECVFLVHPEILSFWPCYLYGWITVHLLGGKGCLVMSRAALITLSELITKQRIFFISDSGESLHLLSVQESLIICKLTPRD